MPDSHAVVGICSSQQHHTGQHHHLHTTITHHHYMTGNSIIQANTTTFIPLPHITITWQATASYRPTPPPSYHCLTAFMQVNNNTSPTASSTANANRYFHLTVQFKFIIELIIISNLTSLIYSSVNLAAQQALGYFLLPPYCTYGQKMHFSFPVYNWPYKMYHALIKKPVFLSKEIKMSTIFVFSFNSSKVFFCRLQYICGQWL